MPAPVWTKFSNLVRLPRPAHHADRMDYIRRLLAFPHVYINGSTRKWRNVEIQDRHEGGSILSQFGLVALPVNPDPIPDPENLDATFMVLEEDGIHWEVSWTQIRAAFGSHPEPFWLRARRTVHHLKDLDIKLDHPEPNARLAKVMQNRQESFEWQGGEASCSLASLAEMSVSFIASLGQTYPQLRSNIRDQGRLDETKRKAITHILGQRAADPDMVQSYMETDPDDHRVACEYGSRLLSDHPELKLEIDNQIMSMSLHTGSDFASSMVSWLGLTLNSTVQPYLVQQISNANLVQAIRTSGGGDSPMARSIILEARRRKSSNRNRPNPSNSVSSLSRSHSSDSGPPRSISTGKEEGHDSSHPAAATE